MKSKVWTLLAVLMVVTLAACAAPTPETIVETVVVEKEVEKIKEVIETVEVEVIKEVEKEVVVTQEVEVEKEVVVEVTAAPEAKPYEGVELNILTFTGPQIAEPLQRRGPDFTELTGAKVNVIVVPFNELYQKLLTDMATGTNSFDAFVFAPQWMVDYITPGYLEVLTDRIAADADLEWGDVAPFFRDFSASYQGDIYTIPLDGDFHMGYYRSDLIDEPPRTWDEYIEIAAEFHGQDLNGDGDPDYGSCISKKRGAQAYWFITDFAAPMIQSQGTSQGTFFNSTMRPPSTARPMS
jgi:multiple sugar transport system substrate-binding protein